MNRSLFLALWSCLLLPGCMPDLKSERPPERIYWLEPVAIADPPAVSPRVQVVPGLDSDRVWLLESDQRLNFYAGVRWPDSLPRLLASLISRSLDSQVREPKVDILIERFFAVEQGGGDPPDIVLSARLDTGDERCRFEAVRPAATARLRDIVAGHQTLLDELTAAIAEFGRSGHCP
jgi:hypothetical protein